MSETGPRRRQRVVAGLGVMLWLLAAAAAVHVGFWIALGTAAVLLGAAVLATDSSAIASLGRQLRRGGLQMVALGLASGALMAATAWQLYPPVVSAVPWIASDTTGLYLSFAALTMTQAALALPPILLGEELFWRGLMHDSFLAHLPASASIPLGALAYAAAIVPTGSPVLMMTALACGLVWSALRVATGGLLAPLVSHLTWNALVLFVHPIGVGVLRP